MSNFQGGVSVSSERQNSDLAKNNIFTQFYIQLQEKVSYNVFSFLTIFVALFWVNLQNNL
jgi:hypothetical protein